LTIAAIARAVADKFWISGAYEYGYIHSQWGDSKRALDWLEKAHALDDGGLVTLKVDPLLHPLRGALKFPD
jgi:hypothetical protein